jgi:membrane protein required for colicin V production
MNWLDVVLIIILAGSVIYSLFQGFVKETFFLAGVFLGFLAALRGYSFGATFLYEAVGNPTTARVLSFLIILISVYALIRITGWRVGKAFEKAGLSALDRGLGAVMGALKGAVLISVFLLLFIGYTDQGKHHVAGSSLSPYFLRFSELLAKALPEDVKEGFRKTYENLQDPERIKELMDTLKRGGDNDFLK